MIIMDDFISEWERHDPCHTGQRFMGVYLSNPYSIICSSMCQVKDSVTIIYKSTLDDK